MKHENVKYDITKLSVLLVAFTTIDTHMFLPIWEKRKFKIFCVLRMKQRFIKY